jgi:hypothetical protein
VRLTAETTLYNTTLNIVYDHMVDLIPSKVPGSRYIGEPD